MKQSSRMAFLRLMLPLLLAFSATAGADDETPPSVEPATQEPDDRFPFTFNDVSANLVIIECKSAAGKSAGSGFIAKSEGKTYIFTNQHVIMGAGTITFTTVAGEQLKPNGVELAATRDIARLPIADRDDALEIGSDIGMGMPIAVFGNSEGAGVATELFGTITGVGAELAEVSAEFVSGNSGSPVIGKNKEVVGIASYVRFSRPSRMTENTRFESQTRRFCYRLNNVKWMPVRWTQYNASYGKTYRETDAFVTSIFDIVNGLFEKPFGNVPESWDNSELKNWATAHNRIVSRSAGSRGVDEIGGSAGALSSLCERRARELEKVLKNRDLTEFLRDEFEGYVQAYNYAAQAIDYFGTRLPAVR